MSAPRHPPACGFTLLELLVTLGLVAVFAAAVIGALGASCGPTLQSAQGALANLVIATRTKAAATNQPARLLVQFDATSAEAPSRFLRHVVAQIEVDGVWQSFADVLLPDGVFVVPGKFAVPDGLFAVGAGTWTRNDGADLRSTALREKNVIVVAAYAGTSERWISLPFAAVGTTNASGDIVLALGRARPFGSYAAPQSPVELVSPDQVRGLSLSAYGVPTLIDDRASF